MFQDLTYALESHPLPELSQLLSAPSPAPAPSPTPATTPDPRLTSHPMFAELQTTLKEECAPETVPFSLLGVASQSPAPPNAHPSPTPQVPVSVRVALLHSRLLLLETYAAMSMSATKLRHFYSVQAAQLECGRHQALVATAMSPWQVAGINSYYDYEHHGLMDRVEQSLQLLETKSAKPHKCPSLPETPPTTCGPSPPAPSGPSPPATHAARFSRPSISPLNPLASRIMANWYERNKEHPYPSYDTAEVLAKAGNISVEQVKRWFANRRLRQGNTKTLSEVAERRKRTRTGSSEVFLSEGKRFRELE